ncbi:hypothetical protein L226DRAFT_550422 [Lentinus tigrinus ALCF2SS1-7]|uniref:Uncharacterized protein n=1 Tax=Lentinus tigrinus ALCF2SS1-6 TaxID=1328759 RepID=A0A5C2SS17_9APHY|nr:hypothetical protein L227DRAFT_590592 [Lentinus tigrinus ALCF2SS1-6]RPD80393.1 hypothetical protein L226DRAFT_550422 [Lentinus tigrinus ALCF2SS1-7]
MYSTPLAVLGLIYASVVTGMTLQRRAVDFFDPAHGGGTMFDNATFGGEPLNVIISGLSSPDVLTDDGVLKYAKANGFSQECFGFHLGAPQTANLGDGHNSKNQTVEIFRQDGPSANSGALFLAASKEKDASKNHDLIDDGYNIGRNELVAAAVGTKSHDGVTYNTVARNITGMMPAGSNGVNHGIAVDGVVTLLTVSIQ